MMNVEKIRVHSNEYVLQKKQIIRAIKTWGNHSFEAYYVGEYDEAQMKKYRDAIQGK